MLPYGYSNDSMGTGKMFLELKNNHFILKQFNFVYLLVKNFQERQIIEVTQKKNMKLEGIPWQDIVLLKEKKYFSAKI